MSQIRELLARRGTGGSEPPAGKELETEMSDQESAATRLVEGRELHLRRRHDAGWEVSFYDITSSGQREAGRRLFPGETFSSPDHAAAACRRLMVL